MDTLKTHDKCLKEMNATLAQKKSVVVDNTNPDKTARKRSATCIALVCQHVAHLLSPRYIDAALKAKARVRCFVMASSRELASHLNLFREALSNGETKRIPEIAYNTYNVRCHICPRALLCSQLIGANRNDLKGPRRRRALTTFAPSTLCRASRATASAASFCSGPMTECSVKVDF